MSRKRSKYRPRGVIINTIGYVMAGLSKVTDNKDGNTVLRIKNNAALYALANATATSSDLDTLINISNMATALKRVGHGGDWSDEIRAGTDAVEAVQLRYLRWRKIQPTPSELSAITLMVDIHEAQLDASRVVDVEKAIVIAQRGVASLATA